jgi:hypothetical protein
LNNRSSNCCASLGGGTKLVGVSMVLPTVLSESALTVKSKMVGSMYAK